MKRTGQANIAIPKGSRLYCVNCSWPFGMANQDICEDQSPEVGMIDGLPWVKDQLMICPRCGKQYHWQWVRQGGNWVFPEGQEQAEKED